MPEVEVHWYDGGMMPDRPKGFPEGKQLMQSGGGLTIDVYKRQGNTSLKSTHTVLLYK